MVLNRDIINKIVKYFKNKPQVEAVYLYGSQARGDARSDSDIDLAVLMEEKSDYFMFESDLSRLLDRKIDVQSLTSCPIDFAHRVILEGKLLISNNEKARIAFEEKIFRDYFDMKPALDEYFKSLSEIARKGELGVRYI